MLYIQLDKRIFMHVPLLFALEPLEFYWPLRLPFSVCEVSAAPLPVGVLATGAHKATIFCLRQNAIVVDVKVIE